MLASILKLIKELIPLTQGHVMDATVSRGPAASRVSLDSFPQTRKRKRMAPSRELPSKLVKGMTPGRNRDGMHVNGYLHKCLHHKIHPGKQHCKGAHTKRNVHISAFPHADTPTPALAKLVWSRDPKHGNRGQLEVKEVGDHGGRSGREN